VLAIIKNRLRAYLRPIRELFAVGHRFQAR
jgi:hypothetical protein